MRSVSRRRKILIAGKITAGRGMDKKRQPECLYPQKSKTTKYPSVTGTQGHPSVKLRRAGRLLGVYVDTQSNSQ